MQLYAFDKDGRTQPAWKAHKHQDYQCLECDGLVRLRGGPHRKAHFYHISVPKNCRQAGKTLPHLQTQAFLERNLNCSLEQRFPTINRIADAVWEERRIVFEVQCSPISAAEVRARNKDYHSIGYRVVWILHEKQFNQWRVSAAEMALQKGLYYFTNMDKDGNGQVYDQFDVIQDGLRTHCLPPLPVNLANFNEQFCSFWGDWHDLKTHQPAHPYVQKAKAIQLSLVEKRSPWWRHKLEQYVLRPYMIVFKAMLEKVSQ